MVGLTPFLLLIIVLVTGAQFAGNSKREKDKFEKEQREKERLEIEKRDRDGVEIETLTSADAKVDATTSDDNNPFEV